MIRAEKHLSHLAGFLLPSLSTWFYHKAGHFFGGDVAKGRILWYTSSNISVNRERASFSIRAIEFYWNEYRMDCASFILAVHLIDGSRKHWMDIWIYFISIDDVIYGNYFSAISVSAICLKLRFNIVCLLCDILCNEKLYGSHIYRKRRVW